MATGLSICALVCLATGLGVPLYGVDSPDYLTLGVKQLRTGATFAAARTLRLAVNQGDDRAHLYLASAYFVLNQHQLFATEIAAAKIAAPSDPEPWYVEGRYLFEAHGRREAAVAQFQHALSKDPEHIKSRCYLGIAFREMHLAKEAEQQLVQAIQLAESRKLRFYLPYQTLAEQLLDLNRLDEAKGYIESAVRIAPEVALNHFLLGKIAWAQSNASHSNSLQAIAALRKTIEIDEAFIEARYLLARILNKQGDVAGSAEQLKEFSALKEIFGAGRLH
ncbi:MAG: hypothetical protein H7039_14430 [Bryobacteraceae bacterium]|nr:hypothetical protein [Bryobacteraceae bacterium]